ncbi:hypothetical protein ACFL2G_04310 [Candidatus Omnitrophota bacterium]
MGKVILLITGVLFLLDAVNITVVFGKDASEKDHLRPHLLSTLNTNSEIEKLSYENELKERGSFARFLELTVRREPKYNDFRNAFLDGTGLTANQIYEGNYITKQDSASYSLSLIQVKLRGLYRMGILERERVSGSNEYRYFFAGKVRNMDFANRLKFIERVNNIELKDGDKGPLRILHRYEISEDKEDPETKEIVRGKMRRLREKVLKIMDRYDSEKAPYKSIIIPEEFISDKYNGEEDLILHTNYSKTSVLETSMDHEIVQRKIKDGEVGDLQFKVNDDLRNVLGPDSAADLMKAIKQGKKFSAVISGKDDNGDSFKFEVNLQDVDFEDIMTKVKDEIGHNPTSFNDVLSVLIAKTVAQNMHKEYTSAYLAGRHIDAEYLARNFTRMIIAGVSVQCNVGNASVSMFVPRISDEEIKDIVQRHILNEKFLYSADWFRGQRGMANSRIILVIETLTAEPIVQELFSLIKNMKILGEFGIKEIRNHGAAYNRSRHQKRRFILKDEGDNYVYDNDEDGKEGISDGGVYRGIGLALNLDEIGLQELKNISSIVEEERKLGDIRIDVDGDKYYDEPLYVSLKATNVITDESMLDHKVVVKKISKAGEVEIDLSLSATEDIVDDIKKGSKISYAINGNNGVSDYSFSLEATVSADNITSIEYLSEKDNSYDLNQKVSMLVSQTLILEARKLFKAAFSEGKIAEAEQLHENFLNLISGNNIINISINGKDPIVVKVPPLTDSEIEFVVKEHGFMPNGLDVMDLIRGKKGMPNSPVVITLEDVTLNRFLRSFFENNKKAMAEKGISRIILKGSIPGVRSRVNKTKHLSKERGFVFLYDDIDEEALNLRNYPARGIFINVPRVDPEYLKAVVEYVKSERARGPLMIDPEVGLDKDVLVYHEDSTKTTIDERADDDQAIKDMIKNNDGIEVHLFINKQARGIRLDDNVEIFKKALQQTKGIETTVKGKDLHNKIPYEIAINESKTVYSEKIYKKIAADIEKSKDMDIYELLKIIVGRGVIARAYARMGSASDEDAARKAQNDFSRLILAGCSINMKFGSIDVTVVVPPLTDDQIMEVVKNHTLMKNFIPSIYLLKAKRNAVGSHVGLVITTRTADPFTYRVFEMLKNKGVLKEAKVAWIKFVTAVPPLRDVFFKLEHVLQNSEDNYGFDDKEAYGELDGFPLYGGVFGLGINVEALPKNWVTLIEQRIIEQEKFLSKQNVLYNISNPLDVIDDSDLFSKWVNDNIMQRGNDAEYRQQAIEKLATALTVQQMNWSLDGVSYSTITRYMEIISGFKQEMDSTVLINLEKAISNYTGKTEGQMIGNIAELSRDILRPQLISSTSEPRSELEILEETDKWLEDIRFVTRLSILRPDNLGENIPHIASVVSGLRQRLESATETVFKISELGMAVENLHQSMIRRDDIPVLREELKVIARAIGGLKARIKELQILKGGVKMILSDILNDIVKLTEKVKEMRQDGYVYYRNTLAPANSFISSMKEKREQIKKSFSKELSKEQGDALFSVINDMEEHADAMSEKYWKDKLAYSGEQDSFAPSVSSYSSYLSKILSAAEKAQKAINKLLAEIPDKKLTGVAKPMLGI